MSTVNDKINEKKFQEVEQARRTATTGSRKVPLLSAYESPCSSKNAHAVR